MASLTIALPARISMSAGTVLSSPVGPEDRPIETTSPGKRSVPASFIHLKITKPIRYKQHKTNIKTASRLRTSRIDAPLGSGYPLWHVLAQSESSIDFLPLLTQTWTAWKAWTNYNTNIHPNTRDPHRTPAFKMHKYVHEKNIYIPWVQGQTERERTWNTKNGCIQFSFINFWNVGCGYSNLQNQQTSTLNSNNKNIINQTHQA